MYKCIRCWNKKYFKEIYRVETNVTIEDEEIAWSYDKKSDLIEILCSDCWDSSEDWNIVTKGIDEKYSKLIIN